MTKEVKSGLIKISIGVVIALIIFVISITPKFRISGKYKLIEIDDMEIEEFNEIVFDDEEAVEIHLNFTYGGKVNAIHNYKSDDVMRDVCRIYNIDADTTSRWDMKSTIEDRVDDYLENSHWSLNGRRMYLRIGDYSELEEYRIEGRILEIEQEEGKIVLEKTGYNFGDVLRLISLIIILCQIFPAVRIMTSKPKKTVIPDLRCPYCNGKVDLYARFCNICGNRFTEENKPHLAKLQPKCSNCGTQAVEGRDYCLNCGCPIER